MANQSPNLLVRIGADTTDFRKRLNDASAKTKTLSGQMGKATGATLKYAAAAAAAGAAIASAMVVKSLSAIDAQAKLAQQLRTTAASMATLERAGQLSGVEMAKIATAGRQLDVALGKAAQGGNLQAAAFDRMGLSAEAVSKLPLDQRINAINQALAKNVSETERASIAADIFGTRNASAIQQLKPDVLAEAERQARLFGQALSDVDAAKVEAANDAMSTIGNAVDGVAKQFTVQLAPILQAVGQMFLDNASEAGGFAGKTEEAFGKVVNAAGFAMDAADAVRRVFLVAGDVIVIAYAKLFETIAEKIASTLKLIDKVPGIDMSGPIASVEGFARTSSSVIAQAKANIDATLAAPLPSEQFKQFVSDAQVAAEAAAQATVKARESMAPVVPMDSARDDAEIQRINQRLEKIREANSTELELLQQKFIAENEAIKEGLAARQISEQQAQELSLGAAQRFSDAKLQIDQARADRELQIERQKEQAKKAILSQAFGGLSSLMNSESKKLFKIGKAAAIGQSIISTFTGMNKALELGWPLGPIAAAAIGAQGFARVASIKAQQFGGGGGNASSATEQINANNAPVNQSGGQSRNVFATFQGINPDSFVQAGSVVDFINREIDDGAVIRGIRFAS